MGYMVFLDCDGQTICDNEQSVILTFILDALCRGRCFISRRHCSFNMRLSHPLCLSKERETLILGRLCAGEIIFWNFCSPEISPKCDRLGWLREGEFRRIEFLQGDTKTRLKQQVPSFVLGSSGPVGVQIIIGCSAEWVRREIMMGG